MTEHYFGYRQVDENEKTEQVQNVFSSVAQYYDIMNDVMSAGMHRLWKRRAISLAKIRPHHSVLDLAAGSGDLTLKIADKLGPKGELTACDLNPDMLAQARDRLLDHGLTQVNCVQADAEELPFDDNKFDSVIIAFGLRNVTHQDRALASMTRVLKPGGRVVILEFSHLAIGPLQKVFDQYTHNVLPMLGTWIAGDHDSYQYLAESIKMHPDQQTLLDNMQQAGLDHCNYYNLTGGAVAIHRGIKL